MAKKVQKLEKQKVKTKNPTSEIDGMANRKKHT